jgi:hypothetical protein
MFKEILEINKNNADQKVTEQFEIFVKTCGSVRQVRSTGGHTACYFDDDYYYSRFKCNFSKEKFTFNFLLTDKETFQTYEKTLFRLVLP